MTKKISQESFDFDSPLTGKVKGERSIMSFPFFHLAKGRRLQPIQYQDDRVTIEVRPSPIGVATIYDKEILLYIASLMVEKMNRGEQPDPEFTFTAHDFLRVTGANRSARSYTRFASALERLQGTQIKTNIEAGGEGEDGFFSWVAEARVQYSRNAKGDKRLKAVRIRLCDWLHRAILKDVRILTYDHRYFSLSPIERRLYEIARTHCGRQEKFVIGIDKLRRRVGCEDTLAKFKHTLKRIATKDPLPEYTMSLAHDPTSPLSKGLRSDGYPTAKHNRNIVVIFIPKHSGPVSIDYLASSIDSEREIKGVA